MRGTGDTGHRMVWYQEGSEQLPRPHKASSQVFITTTTISYSFLVNMKSKAHGDGKALPWHPLVFRYLCFKTVLTVCKGPPPE